MLYVVLAAVAAAVLSPLALRTWAGRALFVAAASVLAALSMPLFALAADAANQPPGPVLTGLPLTDIAIGLVTPLVGYVANHFAPWASEQAKALAQFVLAAGVAAVFQAVGDGNFGWNQQTAVAVLSAVITAVGAHYGYKAGGINDALGAGRNADGTPTARRTIVP